MKGKAAGGGGSGIGTPAAPPPHHLRRGLPPGWRYLAFPLRGERLPPPARSAKAIKISFPSLGKPQPESQPNPGDISQRQRPEGRNPDF